MKSKSLLILLVLCSVTTFGQKAEIDPVVTNGFQDKEKIKQQMALKNRNTKDDKVTIVEVTGMAGGSFSTMNYPDGSSRNNNLSIRTVIKLTVANVSQGSYQLAFYSENEKSLHAVEQSGTETIIHYPLSLYEPIRQKAEQILSLKKKFQIKITTNSDGFTEATVMY